MILGNFFLNPSLNTFNKSFVEQKKFTLDFGHLGNFPHTPITYNKTKSRLFILHSKQN